jgi:F-type H+-transporting ATPase subunit gamma
LLASRIKVRPRSIPQITNLPAEKPPAELTEQYVYAKLCEAVKLSLPPENEARMTAMIAARSNVAQARQACRELPSPA